MYVKRTMLKQDYYRLYGREHLVETKHLQTFAPPFATKFIYRRHPSGLIFQLPDQCPLRVDFQVVDPMMPFTDQTRAVTELLDLRPAPTEVTYIFGRYMMDAKYSPPTRLWPVFGLASLDAPYDKVEVLISARWDLHYGISDVTWRQDMKRFLMDKSHRDIKLRYANVVPDDDNMLSGEYYWVLDATEAGSDMIFNQLWHDHCVRMDQILSLSPELYEAERVQRADARRDLLELLQLIERPGVSRWQTTWNSNSVMVKHADNVFQCYGFRFDEDGVAACRALVDEILETTA